MIQPRVHSSIQVALGVLEALSGLLALLAAVASVTICTGTMGALTSSSGDGVLPGLAFGGFFGVAMGALFVLPALALFAMAALRAITVWYLRVGTQPPGNPGAILLGVGHILAPLLVLGWIFAVSPLFAALLLPIGIVWVLVSVLTALALIPSPPPRSPGAG